MNVKVLLSSLLLLTVVGCSSNGTIGGSTTQKFDMQFLDMNSELQVLYPSQLEKVYPKLKGGNITTVRRDELSHDDQVTIQVVDENPTGKRQTDIVLKELSSTSCEVSIQTSTASKAVLIPPRDKAHEEAVMRKIVEALNKK